MKIEIGAGARRIAANAVSVATSVASSSPFEASTVHLIEPEATPKKSDRPLTTPATLHPAFKLVFWTVVAIVVIAGVAQFAMADRWAAPTPIQQSTFEAAGFAWKAGIGAILGLLGGKAI